MRCIGSYERHSVVTGQQTNPTEPDVAFWCCCCCCPWNYNAPDEICSWGCRWLHFAWDRFIFLLYRSETSKTANIIERIARRYRRLGCFATISLCANLYCSGFHAVDTATALSSCCEPRCFAYPIIFQVHKSCVGSVVSATLDFNFCIGFCMECQAGNNTVVFLTSSYVRGFFWQPHVRLRGFSPCLKVWVHG